MTSLIENIRQQAQSNVQKIILTETEDIRIQQAARICTEQKIADILSVDSDYIKQHSDLYHQFSQELFELRQAKGLTLEESQKLLLKPIYFGIMMVKNHLADGLVAGANTTTQETFRPALQIIKAKPDQKLVSSFFLMQSPLLNFGYNGTFIFADCGLNINPNTEELAQIAIQSADSFQKLIGEKPKIAMLSYSTNGSGSGESVDKVQQATQIIKQLRPDLTVDGEIQADAAIVPQVAQTKFPTGLTKGQANTLIFPDINSGNIAYKLVERLGNTQAIGPISQGLNYPVNDLSRGCSVEDIVNVIAITSIQARQSKP
jgi:phosphate acetyltransferase